MFSVAAVVWQECLEGLGEELSSLDYNTWIRPLQARVDDSRLTILAPNPYVRDRVREKYLKRIRELVQWHGDSMGSITVEIEIGGGERRSGAPLRTETDRHTASHRDNHRDSHEEAINKTFTFDTFVKGPSNELAVATADHVAKNPGRSYNPLLLYGGVGLGKTHLMHAVGNEVMRRSPGFRVTYRHSQAFVAEMVSALKTGTMQAFTQYYRKVDVLLIDDLQFFAHKVQSQDEFFHVFNALFEQRRQMVLTCDRYPRDVEGLEERLKSRFVSGVSAEVDLPDLETRVAILKKKAEVEGYELDDDVAFFVADHIRSNVRELEGALRRIQAHALFTGLRITVEQVREALRDLLAIHDRQISIDNIQGVVAEYYKIRKSDLLLRRRTRTIARPRQMAMYLAKELTKHSLPEIGEAFGGRDHTTVLHAHRRIAELKQSNSDIAEDYRNLNRRLMS